MWAWQIVLGCAGTGSQTVPDGAEPSVDVISVRAVGESGAYTVYVTIRSDETGCDRYADWWEVLTPEGELVYRRILDHSHPDDQPFERFGGPVAIEASEEVVVRGHLHSDREGEGGYVGQAMRGSIAGGFSEWAAPASFAPEVEGPLPESCLF